jgi:hypothetical protein
LIAPRTGSQRRGTPYLVMLSRIHWTRAKSTAAANVFAAAAIPMIMASAMDMGGLIDVMG